MPTKHDNFRADNGEQPGSECPVCLGDGLDEDGKPEPCGECDGFGEIHPAHRKELLTEINSEL